MEKLSSLKEISNFKKDKNLYMEFLNRYYYLPLSVVFKDEHLTKGFSASIVSKLVDGKSNLIKGANVKFTVDSKSYSAKTNSKGIATFKASKLPAGKYTLSFVQKVPEVSQNPKIL